MIKYLKQNDQLKTILKIIMKKTKKSNKFYLL